MAVTPAVYKPKKQTMANNTGSAAGNSAPAGSTAVNTGSTPGGTQASPYYTGSTAGRSRSSINSASAPYQTDANGNVSTRYWMTKAGLDNNLIGYDDARGMVTYNGQDFAKAASETDGTSYLNTQDAQQALTNYYKRQGQNLVEATPYLANQNSPYSYDYNNGTLTVGGIAVPTAFVDNGKAWVLESDLNAALNQLNQNSGLQTGQEILSKYADKYQGMQDAQLDKIVNRDPFEYDPETDQVFQAYKQQYNREGNRSMEDAVGAMNALTGGLTNSAAVTAAGQARQYWSDKLMDRIPELEANAYNRYVGNFNMDRQALSDIMNAYNTDYQREYDANRDLYNDLWAQREWDYNRDQDAWNRGWQEKLTQAQLDQAQAQLDQAAQDLRRGEKEIWWYDANNTQQYESNEINKYLTIADITGQFPQWLIDRNLVDQNSSPWAKQAYQAELEKQAAKYNNELSKELIWTENDANKDYLQYSAKFGGGSSRSGGSSSKKSSGMTSSQYNTFYNNIRKMQEDEKSNAEIANYIEGLGLNAEDKYRLYDTTGVSWAQDVELQRMQENGATMDEMEEYLADQVSAGKITEQRSAYLYNNYARPGWK